MPIKNWDQDDYDILIEFCDWLRNKVYEEWLDDPFPNDCNDDLVQEFLTAERETNEQYH